LCVSRKDVQADAEQTVLRHCDLLSRLKISA
jgi:hypothetical protein